MPILVQFGITLEPIADNPCARRHVRPNETADLSGRGIGQDSDACATSDVALLIDALVLSSTGHGFLFDGAHDHRLIGILTTTSVALLLPAAIERLINLNEIIQLEIVTVLGQRMTQFMTPEPCSSIADGEFSADHEGGHAPFVMGSEIRRHEPLTKRRAGLVENRASGDGMLMAAFGALKDARAGGEVIRLGRLALVASKTVGHPRSDSAWIQASSSRYLSQNARKPDIIHLQWTETITVLWAVQ
jgi:hypothetical protein